MTNICSWLQANHTQCKKKAIPEKNYCKLHKKFETVFAPDELQFLTRCARCNKPVKNEAKCKTCVDAQKKQKVSIREKRNKNKKKCEWVNQKGNPCPWKTNISNLYCKRHSIYENLFTPSDIPSLAKCSGCKNLFKPENGKTCVKCALRSANQSKLNQKIKK